jgi:hypothetical protein
MLSLPNALDNARGLPNKEENCEGPGLYLSNGALTVDNPCVMRGILTENIPGSILEILFAGLA